MVCVQVRGNSEASTQAKDIDNLRAAASAAEAAGMGVYSSNDAIRSSSIFAFDTDTASTGAEALAAFGKGMFLQPAVHDPSTDQPRLFWGEHGM